HGTRGQFELDSRPAQRRDIHRYERPPAGLAQQLFRRARPFQQLNHGLSTDNGSIRWAFQVTPHDVWGWGCKGNIAMIPATVAGSQKQVIAKQCENGYIFMLDPATGALLYSGQAPGVVRASGAQIPNIQNQGAMHASLAS